MRSRPAPFARLLAAPNPAKAAINTASTVAAFPLHQAERVLKKARGAAEFGVHAGLRAVTGVMEAVTSRRTPPPADLDRPESIAQPARRIPPRPAAQPPTARTPAAQPSAARTPPAQPPVAAAPPPDLLLGDAPAADLAPGSAPRTDLHIVGEDVFPIKNYDKLTASEVVVAIRALQRQADVTSVLTRERANRNRKSIATAGETRIAQLDRLDVRT